MDYNSFFLESRWGRNISRLRPIDNPITDAVWTHSREWSFIELIQRYSCHDCWWHGHPHRTPSRHIQTFSILWQERKESCFCHYQLCQWRQTHPACKRETYHLMTKRVMWYNKQQKELLYKITKMYISVKTGFIRHCIQIKHPFKLKQVI